MKNTYYGMVVYTRTPPPRKGIIVVFNSMMNTITVEWDDDQSRSIVKLQDMMSEELYNSMVQEKKVKTLGLKREEAVLDAAVYLMATKAPLRKGRIVAPPRTHSGLVTAIIKWDDGMLSEMQLNSLLNEENGAAENKRLLEEEQRLERQFEELNETCSVKLTAAADLIREAAKLARTIRSSLVDMNGANDLESAMEDGGWNTSSWHC
jgi:hypothetical protein